MITWQIRTIEFENELQIKSCLTKANAESIVKKKQMTSVSVKQKLFSLSFCAYFK